MLEMLDDDFFELDEDLLNASDNLVRADENIVIDESQYKILLLNCTGVDSFKKNSFHQDGFIHNFDVRSLFGVGGTKFVNETMFDLNLSEDVLTIDGRILEVLLNKARMNIQILHVSSRENASFSERKSFFLIRQQVSTLFYQLRQLIICENIHYEIVEAKIQPIAAYLDNLNALPIANVFHTVHSDKGNETKSPGHHLFHGYLEWRWLHMTAVLKIQQHKNHSNELLPNPTLRDTEFEMRLRTFLYDLMVLSAAKFNKLDPSEMSTATPFVCVCVKEMWLMLQLLIEKLHDDGDQINSLWSYFNTILDLFKDSTSPYPNTKGQCAQRDFIPLQPNNFNLFSIWLLNGVACVQGFREDGTFNGAINYRVKENSEYLENVIRSFVNTDQLEQHLRGSLLTLTSLLTEWWKPKADILMLFWEYFHKKLNSSFFVSGAAPSTLAVASNSAEGYLEQIETLLDNTNLNPNMASFSIFIHLLGKLLKRLVQIDMKSQVQKVMGRIFSKFSEAKLAALTEVGIHNVISLFLTLAVSTGLLDIGQRLHTILLQLRLDRIIGPRQVCMAKGHVAMLILYSDQRIGIHSYLLRFLDQISAINSNENKLAVMKILFDGLDRILIRDDYFECGEHLLIDSWLNEFLSLCSITERDKCFEFANRMLTRNSAVNISPLYVDQHLKVQQSLYRFVLPHLQSAYRQCNGLCQIPDIAANFCITANGQNGLPTFNDLFKYFTETPCFDSQTPTKFLISILSTNKADGIDQIASIRLWIKCSMLSVTANDDIQRLTIVIVKLSSFRAMCDIDVADILNAKEPLSQFFVGVGRTYEKSPEPVRRNIAEKFQNCIVGFEKWAAVSETQQTIMKQFIVIALIIWNCSQIVYIRSRPNCFFNIAINQFILPCPVMMGKQQKLYHVQAVLKVWHLIIGGIEKLDYQSDAQLQKVFNDLIVKWLPQFKWLPNQKTVSKPFISCMLHSQPATATLIFDKLVTNFLSAQRRDTHQFSPMVMTILTDVIGAIDANAEKMLLLAKCIIFTLMEHAMMVDDSLPSKRMVFDLFRSLFRSVAFAQDPDLRNLMESNLRTLTTKHLSYHAAVYFQFILKLLNINTMTIKGILPHLREQVGVVEQLRGAGLDTKLRHSLKTIEEAID